MVNNCSVNIAIVSQVVQCHRQLRIHALQAGWSCRDRIMDHAVGIARKDIVRARHYDAISAGHHNAGYTGETQSIGND